MTGKSRWAGVATAAWFVSGAAHAAPFNINAQSASSGIREFARQARIQIIAPASAVANKRTNEVRGELDVAVALRRLLAGTNLEARVGDGVIVLRPAPSASDPGPRAPTAGPPRSRTLEPTVRIDATGIEEIVVTATRRAEALSRVPISATALNQARLEDQGLRTIADMPRSVPGLQFLPETNSVAIRGIASSAGAATTGVYIDETPIQMLNVGIGTRSAIPALYDLERVEVLRGPQGTLFGAGAQGGAVRYITAQPSTTVYTAEADSRVGWVEGGGRDVEAFAIAGGPLVDGRLGVRASVFTRRMGGWIDRLDYRDYALADRDYNTGAVYGGRLAILHVPTERLSLTYALMAQKRTTNGVVGFSDFHSDPGRGVFRTSISQTARDVDRWGLGSIRVDYETDGFRATSNTSLFKRTNPYAYPAIDYMTSVFDSRPEYFRPGVGRLVSAAGVQLPLADYDVTARQTNRQTNFVQELRLQSFELEGRPTWVMGAYYQRNLASNFEYIRDPHIDRATEAIFGMTAREYFNLIYLDNKGDLGPLLPNGDTYNGLYKTIDEQLAVYGQIDWPLRRKLTLTVGARYSLNRFDFSQRADGYINVGPSNGSGRSTERPFTPKVALAYQHDDRNLFYLQYAKGYRIGGANAYIPPIPCQDGLAQLGLTDTPSTYRSDNTRSFEAGAKNRVFDGRLQLSSSAYYIVWSKIQQATTVPICAYRFIDNSGRAVSRGVDIEAQAYLLDGLRVELAFGYNDARFSDEVSSAGRVVVRDGTWLGGPAWTLALGAIYDFQAFGRPSFLRIDWQHSGRQRGLTATQDPRIPRTYDPAIPIPPASDYTTIRAGTSLGRVRATVLVENLLNDAEVLLRTRRSRTWPDFRSIAWRPRTVSVGLAVKY
ncbi:TonB-dependent receptor domain-containing protein [Phenylobacterium sp.]|uniref:TonB-dependent receptor domain-containing protein n=1 Tax=Phenylobacterium sp. TaxID=1871053 RepID=UPI003783C01E